MRQLAHHAALAGAALASLGWILTAAAQTANQGAVVQSVPPPVSQKITVPPLHLSDAQRNQIQQALRGESTEVTFGTKTTKPTQSFNPTVGAKIPASLKPHTLPPPVLSQMPELKRYTYLKFKQQVLIVDPMSRKIVDIFPEA
ncbi:MAG: hypothetical protein JO328_09510 [Hyphomicrobiales bacterium]|nr:hypothetical protein [Hyphomicrobiales bacterium]MBV8824395.1 hypothetical protein [Hyphomicrobiales bacterium]